jgi:sRNA-binding carbon storage regulator CsrA
MLILSRKKLESVVDGGRVKLGFEADDDIHVHRLEIWERMCAASELTRLSGDLESPPARAG